MNNEYEEIYKQYDGSGFKFNYNKRRIGKSKTIFREEISKIDSSKFNAEGIPLFVNCKACETYMDFKEGPEKMVFDSWRVCPVCGVRVKEETLYRQLDRENTDFGRSIDYDEKPEVCAECGGPWPECQSGCRLFRD
jgi:hypothetical protein